MDSFQAYVYLLEIIQQCEMGRLAFRHVSGIEAATRERRARMAAAYRITPISQAIEAIKGLGPESPEGEHGVPMLFLYAEAMLTHVATVSHFLTGDIHGKNPQRKRWAMERAESLRSVLDITEAHWILDRRVRDGIVHIDERIDLAALGELAAGVAFRTVSESSSHSPPPLWGGRELLYDTLTYRLQGHEFDLRAADAELARIIERAKSWIEGWRVWEERDELERLRQGLVEPPDFISE